VGPTLYVDNLSSFPPGEGDVRKKKSRGEGKTRKMVSKRKEIESEESEGSERARAGDRA
jgi:hypothetical protein